MKVKSEIGGSRELGRVVIAFGDAQWRVGADQVYRLVGGDERDRMEARQWISLFRPDAIIGQAPFRVTGVREARDGAARNHHPRTGADRSHLRGYHP